MNAKGKKENSTETHMPGNQQEVYNHEKSLVCTVRCTDPAEQH